MNVSQAIGALVSLASMLFPEASNGPFDREENSAILKQVVEGTLQATGFALDVKMNDGVRPATRCKVYVYLLTCSTFRNIRFRVLYAATSANINHPQAFRTYSARGS